MQKNVIVVYKFTFSKSPNHCSLCTGKAMHVNLPRIDVHSNFTTETMDAKTGDKFPLSACLFLSNLTFRRNPAKYFGMWRRRDLLTTTRVISSPSILQYWTLR